MSACRSPFSPGLAEKTAVHAVLTLQPPALASTGCGRRRFLPPRGSGKRDPGAAAPLPLPSALQEHSGVPPAALRSARDRYRSTR
jgi:hypothetical protein